MTWVTIPNGISIARIALAPALLYLAWTGRVALFLLLLVILVLSDFADGHLARKRGQVSELGAQLDGWGDLAIYLAVPVCSWWLWPEVIRPEAPFVVTVIASYTLTTAIGLLRYGRLESYHTWGGRVSGTLLGAGALLLLAGVSAWPLRIAAVVVVLADLEEIAMMAVLPRWRSDVPSLWHAMRSREAR